MFENTISENNESTQIKIHKMFAKDYKIKYNKKLSGKIKLYLSERNVMKSIGGVLSLHKYFTS